MKLKLAMLLVALMLAGCKMQPFSRDSMVPPEAVYAQLEPDPYLQGKVAVGGFTYRGDNSRLSEAYLHAGEAMEKGLDKAKLLYHTVANAPYVLSAEIRDVQAPSCFFGTCDGGAAVDYVLTERATQRVAYQDLIVVPYTFTYTVFTGSDTQRQRQGYAGAVGENIAHMMHVLTTLTQKQLEGK
jgi:hypothetical protein